MYTPAVCNVTFTNIVHLCTRARSRARVCTSTPVQPSPPRKVSLLSLVPSPLPHHQLSLDHVLIPSRGQHQDSEHCAGHTQLNTSVPLSMSSGGQDLVRLAHHANSTWDGGTQMSPHKCWRHLVPILKTDKLTPPWPAVSRPRPPHPREVTCVSFANIYCGQPQRQNQLPWVPTIWLHNLVCRPALAPPTHPPRSRLVAGFLSFLKHAATNIAFCKYLALLSSQTRAFRNVSALASPRLS